MRIIGGELRNSRLPVLARAGLRPTPDRVRETVFNWLAGVIDGSRCLDLHAGSGALGIEALSRGAHSVSMVESDRDLADNLRLQVERLKVDARALVHCVSAAEFLRGAPTSPFDIAFVDPPYAAQAWGAALDGLSADGWLAAGAFVYLEWPHPQRPELPAFFHWWREARAGAIGFGLARPAAQHNTAKRIE